MNVGGFSDDVFRLMAEFAAGTTTRDHWVKEIANVELI
jgi:60 kDa SS-A/Ro ribonucleoprotein